MDTWQRRERQRYLNENRMLRTEIARLNARVAELELQRMIEANRDRMDVAWLQGKVLRQARRLKALEDAKALSSHLSVEDAKGRAEEQAREEVT